jgi:5-methyltetrahydropteroyltriglutamate--homocysteine methyltransferase
MMSIYRAEVVGSLLRPAWLKDARAALQQGKLSAAEFKRIEDRASMLPWLSRKRLAST